MKISYKFHKLTGKLTIYIEGIPLHKHGDEAKKLHEKLKRKGAKK